MRVLLLMIGMLALSGFSPLKGLKKFVLPNGLTVYVKEIHKLPVVSLQLWVRAGSIDENEQNNGVSHFLEHMLFKGTSNYSVGEISRVVESKGGVINAGTSKEFTEYYIDITTNGFVDALKIIADVAQNALLPEDELERERLVILEEIKRSEDNPETVLYEKFNSLLFTATPYRRRIIGTTTTVSNLSKENIQNYYRQFYQPDNMVLVIMGDIKYKETVELVKKTFSYLKPSETTPKRPPLLEPVKSPVVEKIKGPVQQSYLLCGFLGPELDSKYQYAGDILAIVLGGGKSSRLYRKLREEKRLVWSIGSGFYTQQGTSMFVVSALNEPDKTNEIIKEIRKEMDSLITEEITESELLKAKEIIRSGWYFGQETAHQQASTVGYWALCNRLHKIKKYLRNINKVKPEDIKKFIKTYYTGLTGAVIEPENVQVQ